MVELLWLFLEYLTGGRVDIARDCLTLRGQGEVIDKACWEGARRLDLTGRRAGQGQGGRGSGSGLEEWPSGRLSVEDPFERADSIAGHDLCRTLTTRSASAESVVDPLPSIHPPCRQTARGQ